MYPIPECVERIDDFDPDEGGVINVNHVHTLSGTNWHIQGSTLVQLICHFNIHVLLNNNEIG